MISEEGIPENGCELHPDCFTCPFTDCMKTTARTQKRLQRNQVIRDRRKKGVAVQELVAEFGVSRSTVQRALR